MEVMFSTIFFCCAIKKTSPFGQISILLYVYLLGMPRFLQGKTAPLRKKAESPFLLLGEAARFSQGDKNRAPFLKKRGVPSLRQAEKEPGQLPGTLLTKI